MTDAGSRRRGRRGRTSCAAGRLGCGIGSTPSVLSRRRRLLVHDGVELLARLELEDLPRRDGDLVARLRVSPLAGALGADLERTESDELDLLALLQRVLDELHGGLHGLHGLF